jgi:hypothetical protein
MGKSSVGTGTLGIWLKISNFESILTYKKWKNDPSFYRLLPRREGAFWQPYVTAWPVLRRNPRGDYL